MSNVTTEPDEDEDDIVDEDPETAKLDPLEGFKGETITSVMKSVRAKCMQCSGTSYEIKKCMCFSCALYPFRLGKNPYRQKRVMTDEQKQAAKERFAKARKLKKGVSNG